MDYAYKHIVQTISAFLISIIPPPPPPRLFFVKAIV